MPRTTCLSGPRRSVSVLASNSIRQAQITLHLLEWIRQRPPSPVVDQALFGEIPVLELG